MNRTCISFAGLCLLLSACSGSTDDAGNPSEPSAGAAGTAAPTGGASAAGAPSGSAGAVSAAGASNSGGAGQGGESAVAGAGGSGGAGQAGAPAGGSSNSGGAGGSGGGSAGAAQGGGSASAIDYSIWVLQLPTGSGDSVTTINSKQLLAGYKDDYFYPAADGGQIFMDPETGIGTSGSQHCRTEMRESTTSGGEAAWSSSGTNTLTVTGKVIQVGGGNSGTVTVGQLFNGTDSIPLIELEYGTSAKGFKMLYEEAKGGGATTNLNAPVAIGTKYKFTLSMIKGVASVSINDKQVYSHMPSAGILAKKFYFKVGNYDQNTTKGAISKVPFTVVEAYTVDVVHQ